MKIVLSEREWTKVDDLEDDAFYFMQSQNGIFYYTQSEELPDDETLGVKDSWIKFQKHADNDIYLKPLNPETVISCEKI